MAADEVDRVTPVFWGLFSMGGFVVAFLLPVFIIMNSLAYALHLVPWEKVEYGGALRWIRGDPASALLGGSLAWLGGWLPKLFLVLIVGGGLFHGLHRFKYILYDLGLHKAKKVLDPILYGLAAAGTVAAVVLAFSFP
jgi:fumarate reductase subunit D